MNDAVIRTFEPEFDGFTLDRPAVLKALGYPGPAPAPVVESIDGLWTQAGDHVRIRCGTSLHDSRMQIKRDRFHCQAMDFLCGARICGHLKGSTGLVVFAATLGHEFDRWSKAFFDLGDPYLGYLSNTLGSVLVETVVDWLETQVQADAAARGLRCTNRLSPGYCGWDVAEQHKLFKLMPDRFCGITLMESALMVPIKSVSGIIGLGAGAQRLAYACQACDADHCLMRRWAP